MGLRNVAYIWWLMRADTKLVVYHHLGLVSIEYRPNRRSYYICYSFLCKVFFFFLSYLFS